MPAWSHRPRPPHLLHSVLERGLLRRGRAGRMLVLPRGDGGPALALPEVVDRPRRAGLKLPLLLRFSDILGQPPGQAAGRVRPRHAPISTTSGGYTAVYPIKVNQHRGVAGELAAARRRRLRPRSRLQARADGGAGAGQARQLVICNGYKDREYIRLALIGRKLGLQTFIVIEKPSELAMVIEEVARRSACARAWACACAWPRSAPASGRTPAATRPSSACRRARCSTWSSA